MSRDPLDVLGAPVASADLEALRTRFAAAARDQGLLDVAYRTLDTRLGTLLLAATSRGLVSVTFDGAAPVATLERLATVLSPRVVRAPGVLSTAARSLEALVEGSARAFDGPLDLTLAHGFGRDVVLALQRIPYGETRSYGQIASEVGSPRAVRAVGTACRKNPLPIAIPCHRVVRSDGSLGEYAGGAAAKAMLLATERVQ